MNTPTTEGNTMIERRTLLAVEPGDHLVAVEAMKLRGPRGGRYTFDGTRVNAVLASRVREGNNYVLNFEGNYLPVVISANLARIARAQVEVAA